MPNISTGRTMIKFGSHLRIGYRPQGSAGPFIYLPQYFTQEQLPVTFTVPATGDWEIEYTEICPNCSGGIYSDSQTTTVGT